METNVLTSVLQFCSKQYHWEHFILVYDETTPKGKLQEDEKEAPEESLTLTYTFPSFGAFCQIYMRNKYQVYTK